MSVFFSAFYRSRSARLVSMYLEDRWRILLDPLPPLSPSSSSSPAFSSFSTSIAVGSSDQDIQGKESEEEKEKDRPGERKDKEKKKEDSHDEENPEEEAMRKTGDEYDVFSDPSCCYFSYLHKRRFLSEAYLPDCQRPYLFLVNEESKILWCEHEAFSLSKKAFGFQQIQDLLQISPSSSSYLRLPATSSSSSFSSASSCSSLSSHPVLSLQPSTVHQEEKKKEILLSSSFSPSEDMKKKEIQALPLHVKKKALQEINSLISR